MKKKVLKYNGVDTLAHISNKAIMYNRVLSEKEIKDVYKKTKTLNKFKKQTNKPKPK